MKRCGAVTALLFCLLAATVAQGKTGDKIAIWPLLYYNPTEGQTDLKVLWPLFESKESSEKTSWRLLLTIYQRKHPQKETAWDLIWPIWRLKYDESGDFHSRFFPLFFGHWDERKYAVLFPESWWFYRGKGDYSVFLLPWGRNRTSDTDYFNALTPLWWGRDGQQRYGTLLPLAHWNIKNKNDKTYVLFPFFHHRDSTTESTTGFLPWWVTRDGDRRLVNLFPVLWQKRGEKMDLFMVLPLFYHSKKADVLFPLYWNIPEKLRVFFPLYWEWGDTILALPFYGKGETHGVKWETYLPPIYVHQAEGDYRERALLWPLIAHGRGGDRKLDRFFPLFNYDRKTDEHDLALLWPLYHEKGYKDTRERQILSALPIGLGKRIDAWNSWHALNLFWWGQSHDSSRHGLYPLYSFERTSPDSSRESTAPGATASRVTVQARDSSKFRLIDPLTPLDTHYFDFSEFPILSWFLPIFEASKEKTGTLVSEKPSDPFEWEKWDIRRHVRFASSLVLDWGWNKNSSDLHALTFFWDIKARDRHSQGFWPLYTYKRNPSGGVNASFLDPLWFLGMAKGEEDHVSALFKIFDYRRQPNGDSRFNFIWRAYRREKTGEKTSWEAFPFMAWEKSPERSRFSFVWRLFEYEKTDGKRSMRLLFSPKIGLGRSKQGSSP